MKNLFIKIKTTKDEDYIINVNHIVYIEIFRKTTPIYAQIQTSSCYFTINIKDWEIIKKKMEKTCSILDALSPPNNEIKTPYIKAIYRRKPYEKEQTLNYEVVLNDKFLNNPSFETEEEAQNYLNNIGKKNEN